MHRLISAALVAAALLVVAACSSAEPSTTTTTQATTSTTVAATTTSTTAPASSKAPEVGLDVVPRTYEEFRAQTTICGAEAPEPLTPMEFEAPEDLAIDASSPVTATIATSCGGIVIALDPALALATVNSFVFLADEGYFDGSVFHRLIPGFVLQGGDPTATGRGGPGYSIADEFPPAGVGYEPGTLAMANAGPGTTGSQFFVVLDSIGLPPQYSIFGQIVEGLEILDRLQAVPLGQAAGSADSSPSTPLETIYINSVTIER